MSAGNRTRVLCKSSKCSEPLSFSPVPETSSLNWFHGIAFPFKQPVCNSHHISVILLGRGSVLLKNSVGLGAAHCCVIKRRLSPGKMWAVLAFSHHRGRMMPTQSRTQSHRKVTGRGAGSTGVQRWPQALQKPCSSAGPSSCTGDAASPQASTKECP